MQYRKTKYDGNAMESNNWLFRFISKTWGSLSEEKDRGYVVGGSLFSAVHVPTIFGLNVHGWVTALNAFGGIAYPVISAVLIKYSLRYLDKKVVPKIKFLNDVTEKKDDN